MSSFNTKYISANRRELQERQKTFPSLSPWDVLNVIYEVCEQHLLTNPTKELGYAIDLKYSTDDTKSDISLRLGHDPKSRTPGKYPAFVVFRGPAVVNSSKTLGQLIGINVAESVENRVAQIQMPVKIMVIAEGLGPVEMLADYMKYPFLYFAQEIQKSYCLDRLRFTGIGTPFLLHDQAKDIYGVELSMETEFYNSWTTKGDHLKLKTVTMEASTSDAEDPLKNQ